MYLNLVNLFVTVVAPPVLDDHADDGKLITAIMYSLEHSKSHLMIVLTCKMLSTTKKVETRLNRSIACGGEIRIMLYNEQFRGINIHHVLLID